MPRTPHRIRPSAATIAVGGAGVLVSALALGLMTTPSSAFLAPFASTAAIKYAAPESPMAQPRSVLGGHLIGALVGVIVGQLIGGSVIGPAVAAAIAMAFMIPSHTVHPPAIGVAVLACQHAATPWASLEAVAVAGAITTVCAVVLYRVLHRTSYPVAGWAQGFLAPRATPADS
ncbi:MAG TPA: HPP family protein [Baekduia sp.]|nr:HPP family protein [Baekduia sp.]